MWAAHHQEVLLNQSSSPPSANRSSLFLAFRCVTSSTKTARGCCWCTTLACGRASMPSTAGWARWNRKWAPRPTWTASCSSSAPTRSELGKGNSWKVVKIWPAWPVPAVIEWKPKSGWNRVMDAGFQLWFTCRVSSCPCRWTWQSGGWWTRGRGVCGRSPEASITLRRRRRAERASMRCFRWTHTHSPGSCDLWLWCNETLCLRPRRSSRPSPTCARTAASVQWPRSASASPRSRPTPSGASAIARTHGTCWASNQAPHGE